MRNGLPETVMELVLAKEARWEALWRRLGRLDHRHPYPLRLEDHLASMACEGEDPPQYRKSAWIGEGRDARVWSAYLENVPDAAADGLVLKEFDLRDLAQADDAARARERRRDDYRSQIRAARGRSQPIDDPARDAREREDLEMHEQLARFWRGQYEEQLTRLGASIGMLFGTALDTHLDGIVARPAAYTTSALPDPPGARPPRNATHRLGRAAEADTATRSSPRGESAAESPRVTVCQARYEGTLEGKLLELEKGHREGAIAARGYERDVALLLLGTVEMVSQRLEAGWLDPDFKGANVLLERAAYERSGGFRIRLIDQGSWRPHGELLESLTQDEIAALIPSDEKGMDITYAAAPTRRLDYVLSAGKEGRYSATPCDDPAMIASEFLAALGLYGGVAVPGKDQGPERLSQYCRDIVHARNEFIEGRLLPVLPGKLQALRPVLVDALIGGELDYFMEMGEFRERIREACDDILGGAVRGGACRYDRGQILLAYRSAPAAR